MAGVEIDSLQLEIAADSSQAEKSLDRLSASLNGLSKTLQRVGTSGLNSFRKLTGSINALNSMKLPDFSKMITQLETLSKVDLKNLDGRQIKMDIVVNGMSETERLKYSMQKTAADIRNITDGIAKDIARAYDIKGTDRKKLENLFAGIGAERANGRSGGEALDNAYKFILDNGKIAVADFNEDVAAMRDEYQNFLDYLKANKIKLTTEVDKKTFNEAIKNNERIAYFNQDSGTALDTRWEEMANMFPGILSGLRDVKNEEDQVYAVLEKIREAKDAVDQKSISLFDKQAMSGIETAVYQSVMDGYRRASEGVSGEIATNMQASTKEIPIDVVIDPKRFEQSIWNAVTEAKKVDYGEIDLKLKVNTESFKQNINEAFGNLDIERMQGLAAELRNMYTSLQGFGSLSLKETGVTNFVNSLKRLTEVQDISTSAEGIKAVVASLQGIISMDMSGFNTDIIKFVNAIAKLAKVNESGISTDKLRELSDVINQLAMSFANTQFSDGSVRMAEAIAKIVANSSRASKALDSVREETNRTSEVMEKGALRFDAFRDSVVGVVNALKQITSKALSGIKGAISSFKNLTSHKHGIDNLTFSVKTLLTTLIGFHGIRGIFNWAKDAITLGGDITEIDHIVESVYGNMSDTVKSWSNNMIDNYGVASGAAKRYAGTLTAMAKASGIAADQASVMGVRLTEAAADISAFFNISQDEAYQKIQSGMAGMVRPLRSLGIDISAATLKQYALTQGIQKSYAAMTQSEKMLLRYDYIMKVLSKDAEVGIGVLGDYERTQYSYANSLRKLQAYLTSIKTQIGVGFAAAIRPALVAINELMKGLLKAATAFATFMKTLFPFVNGASGMALQDNAMYADDLADSVDDAASGLDDASDSAKQLKKDLSVLPFDELNQLNKDRESTSSGKGSGVGGGLGDIGTGSLFDWDGVLDGLKESKLPDAIDEWAQRIKESFENKDWVGLGKNIAGLINLGIDDLYKILDPEKARNKINPFIDAFTTTFNSMVSGIHWNTLGRDIGRGINILVNAANRLIDPRTGINWKNLGKKFADGANGLIDEVNFTNLGNLFGNKFMVLWNTAYGFVSDFDWVDLGKKLGEGVNGLNDGISWKTVGDTLSTGLNGAFDSLKKFALTVDWKGLVENISSGINTFIRKFDWKENGHTLQIFLENLVGALVDFLQKVDWKAFGSGIAEMIHEIKWLDLLGKAAGAIIDALGELLKGLISQPEGVFITAIAAGFGAVKLGTAIDKLTGNMATVIKGEKSVGVIKAAFDALFSSGLSGLTPTLGPIALAVAGIAGGIYVAESSMKDNMPKISQDVKNLKEECDLALKGAGKIKSTFEDAMSAVQEETEKSEKLAAPYLETLKGLASKTGELSNAERIRASEAIQGLIDIYPGLNGQISTQDTNLGKVVATAQNYISSVKNMAIAEVYYTKIKEATEQLVEIDEQRKEVGEKLEKLEGSLNRHFEKQGPLVEKVAELTGKRATNTNELVTYLDELGTQQITVNEETKAASEFASQLCEDLAEEEKKTKDVKAEQGLLGEKLHELNGARAEITGTINAWDTELGKLDTTTQGTTKSLGTLADDAKKIPTDIKTGVTHTQGMPSEIIDKISKDMLLAMTRKPEGSDKSEFETESENIPQDAADGIENNAQVATDAAANLSDDMHESYENAFAQNGGVYLVSSKEIPQDIAEGIAEDQHLAVEAIQALCRKMKSEFDNKLNGENGLGSVLKTSGAGLVGKIVSGMDSKLESLGNKVDEVYKKIAKLTGKFESLNDDFYNAGQDLAQSIANGLASVHIEVPHVEFDGTYTRMYTGLDTWVEIPNYQVNWWAKGGLFTRPTLLSGLGEAGDEGVIPLSDKRAMSRIADAIVDNSGGGLGVSKQDIVDAVVYAMATNSQNQPPLNVYATLYTEDNEVLARAVERGNQSRDMRYNPTPAY